MALTDFKFLVEHTIHPLLIFNHDGHISYTNKSAELLAGIHLSIELFRLAMNYAPKSFGAKTTYIDLAYGIDNFYAITVLYQNEEEIGLYLYKKPRDLIPESLSFDGYTLTDINILIEANIELFKIKYTGKLTLLTDYSLPRFKIHQNHFSMLLRKIFECYSDAENIDISLTIKLGETIVIDSEKYPIVAFKIKANHRDIKNDMHIKQLTMQNHFSYYFDNTTTVLELPCIGMTDAI